MDTEKNVREGMTMGRYRLVASDIDGTLLLNWNPSGIDPRVFACVRELAARGVVFLASSGRQHANLRRLFAPVADDICYLCENGALVVWRGTTLVRHEMPRDLALEVCRAIMDTPGCDLLVSGERTHYVLEGEDAFLDHMVNVVGNDVETVQRPEEVAEPILKVSYHASDEVMRATAKAFSERFLGRCKVVTSGATWMDVMAAGVDKGVAMRELGEELGIAPAETMAFGDNLNDAEMLDLVGAPYLMESGNPALLGLNDRLRTCASVHGTLEALLAEGAF